MEHIDVDPTEHPDYLTLSEAGKECGVGMRVLQKLVRDRRIVEGVARTKRGTPYLHRDHVPSWSQIEAILAQMYLQQLARVEKAMKNLEVEVEAVRFDLSEVHADPDARSGTICARRLICRSTRRAGQCRGRRASSVAR
ncbi:hypothetical protein I0Q12_11010 [Rhodococcus sp. CX]|uniref:hypothetical protein n=1 Tax=Rhodococcus sp. CX TaxID=2789880 RepID=UPI0018CF051C|nr:hypothetical protein [Rhodococcus sp. CX]MBH0120015.1 hypothetical protein [Rhodococcus sp. CX]